MKFSLNILLFLSISSTSTAQLISVGEAVELALEKNFDVRVQRAAAELAFNDNRFASGAFLPQINATGAYLKNSNDSRSVTFANLERKVNGARSTNLNGSASMFWPIFDGGKMFATRRRVAELASLGDVNVKNQMMNSVAAVITNYYNIVRQKQQLKAIQELIGVNLVRVQLAEKKLQVGTGGKPELLQAKVDYNAQRILELQQETLIQQLKDQLNGLLGMGLPDIYEISDSIPIDLNLTMEEIISGIENTNPTLLAAKKNIEIAEIIVRENRASRSPTIGLTASYNYGKTENTLATSPFSLQYSRNQGYNYGASVTVPILNGFNVNRLVNQAKITLDRIKTLYEQQKAIAIVGVRNAFVSYENAKKALQIEEENILVARENAYISLESFKRGVATYIELRTAQQTALDTETQLILARYNAKAAETELLRLKGALLK